jgi:hypothetical protein
MPANHLKPGSALLATVLASVLWSGAGLANDIADDPLAVLPALAEVELSELSGRQGISISDQELYAITQNGSLTAGGDISTGLVHLGDSMQHMRGMANQALNTGNNASVNAGMTVHIHLH